jgi:hypothetical protein
MKTNVTSFMNSPGSTIIRSLGDEEFDCIDDFAEDEFLCNDYKNILFVRCMLVNR